MIPLLYKKDGTTKIGELTNCIECLVEEERNGLFEVSLIYPTTDSLFNSLEEENIIVCNANDTLLNQKFRIYMTRKLMSNRIEVFARHISFDLAYDTIDSIDITNQSCEYALNTIFRQSQFSTNYKGYSDIINAQDYKISMCNCIEAIAGKEGSIIDTFGTGAEILRDNTNIHVLNKRGHDNGVTIEYSKNLTGFELEEDTTDLITRIMPYAKYNNETNEEIMIKANAVDSPLINNYSHPYIAYIDYSDKFEDGEEVTIDKLVTFAENEYRDNKVDIPKQNYKIEFVPLSKCVGYEGLEDKISICDTVTIKDTRYNIDTKAKVIRTVFDVLKNRYESTELGEPRTTLGDIIGGSGEDGKTGPPGPQGPPGADGNIGDFPDSLPSTPVLSAKLYGFASIELSWTFENKVYYQYELYASKTNNFTPNAFDLIHAGQSSSFLFQAKPNETWHFRVCAVNSHGNRTSFSDQVSVTTTKIDDLSNYVDNMAIGEALIGTLSLDRGWIGKLNASYLDVKGNFSVTDGNGKRTLDIDSFGNVVLDVTSLKLHSSNVATEDFAESLNKKNVKNMDVMYYLSNSNTQLIGGSWQTVAPVWTSGKYMWQKTVTTFVDGTTKESQPTCIAGARGQDGTDGVSIISVTEQYGINTSKISPPTSWSETFPTWSRGKYIWTRSKITYSNSSISYTDPYVDTSWEQIMDDVDNKVNNNQEDIFNGLTNNGEDQGIYLQNGKLYLNGEYMEIDSLKVGDFTNLAILESNSTFIGSSGGNVNGYEVSSIVGSEKYNHTVLTKKIYNAEAGDNYRVRCKVKSGTNDSANLCITLCWRDNTGSLLSTVTTTVISNSFVDMNNIITVPTKPANGAYINFKIHIQDGTYRRAYVEGLEIRRMANADLIVDGAITADKLHVNAVDGRTIKGAIIVGGELRGSSNFFTAPDSNATDGYGFRIYSTGAMYTNNDIQIEGNGNHVRLGKNGVIDCSTKLVSPNITTGDSALWFGVKGAGRDFSKYNLIFREESDSYMYFRPGNNSTIFLGYPSAMFNTAYVRNGVSSSSDRVLKENIQYLSTTTNPNCKISNDITESDLYNFVRDDLVTATYNFIGDDKQQIGFIAQDLLYNVDGSDNVIGQMIVNKPDNEQSPLTYNEKIYTNTLAGALRHAILKIEELEKKIKVLESN